jgi:toxin CptA
MSIAVSALVRPSHIQRLVWGGCGLAHCASALAVGLLAPERFLLAPLLALALAGAGACVLGAAVRRPKTHRIDISGTGDLRVTVQQHVDGRDRTEQEGAAQEGAAQESAAQESAAQDSAAQESAALEGGAVALLPDSVIWPMLMLVRYATPGARPRVLAVWRDSVEPAAWRALAVALAVAGRRPHAGEGCEDTTNSLQRTNS